MFCSPALNAIEIGMRTRPRKPQRSLPFAGPGPRAAGAQPAGIYMNKASSPRTPDRKSVQMGKEVSVRVGLGCTRCSKKQNKTIHTTHTIITTHTKYLKYT